MGQSRDMNGWMLRVPGLALAAGIGALLCGCGGSSAPDGNGGDAAQESTGQSEATERQDAASGEETDAGDGRYALGFTMPRIDGIEESLEAYRGSVVLVVNVASACGLTPQYEGLEALYERHAGDGLVVLGFPVNNFGNQEPGTNH